MKKTSYKGVYQRGSTYTYMIDLPPDPLTGERRQKAKGGFKSARAANIARTEALSEIYKGTYVEENKMTVAEYMQLYLDTHAKPNFKPTSYDTERTIIEARIVPELGKLQLQKLTPLRIKQFYAKLSESYSSDYVRNIHGVIRRALRLAFIDGLITSNIMEKVRTPKVQRKEMNYWTYEEWNKFIRVAEGHVHFIVFALGVYTGMRRGEILGLRWRDIDLGRGLFTINQQVNWTRSGLIIQPSTKTDDSNRPVLIDKYLLEHLKQRKEQIEAFKKKYGSSYDDHDLVCCYEYGGPVKPKRITEAFDVLTRKAGLKKIRFHDLRHTYASFLLSIGINPKVAAERMGMSPQMFNQRYSHLLPNMQQEAVAKIEEALQKLHPAT